MSGRLKGWAPLQKGDLVDIVCPGSRTSIDTIEKGVLALESWGLRARVSSQLFGKDVICANTDVNRAKNLRQALYAEDSKAVWCARGGYGSHRLIPELLKWKKPSHVKLFIGLSDISSLHLFLNQIWQWPTLHGPLLDRVALQKVRPRYEKELQEVIFGETSSLEFANLKALNEAAQSSQKISGSITGGNLVVMGGHLGTKLKWNTQNKIVFFEDIGERGYRIDRVLEQMKQASVFENCSAVLFGDFTGGDEPDGKSKVWPIINRFAEELKVPVLKGIQSGHAEIQRPLPLGTSVQLYLGSRPRLVCQMGQKRNQSE